MEGRKEENRFEERRLEVVAGRIERLLSIKYSITGQKDLDTKNSLTVRPQDKYTPKL
jgi:hypothetical protein